MEHGNHTPLVMVIQERHRMDATHVQVPMELLETEHLRQDLATQEETEEIMEEIGLEMEDQDQGAMEDLDKTLEETETTMVEIGQEITEGRETILGECLEIVLEVRGQIIMVEIITEIMELLQTEMKLLNLLHPNSHLFTKNSKNQKVFQPPVATGETTTKRRIPSIYQKVA